MYTEFHNIQHPDVEKVSYENLDDRPGYFLNDDEECRYGYDTEITKSLATGELAERIRRAFKIEDPEAEVWLIEESDDASYSEYTQEQYAHFKVECDGREKRFSGIFSFDYMLKWLDKEAPVK